MIEKTKLKHRLLEYEIRKKKENQNNSFAFTHLYLNTSPSCNFFITQLFRNSMQSYKWTQTLLTILIFQLYIYVITTSDTVSAKMDEILDPSIKCGECPCGNSCSQPPPPPASPPPPPPPRFVYTTVLTAPPPPRFNYLTGPPGSLYPLDPFNKIYSINAAQKYSIEVRVILVLVCAVLQALM